MFNYDTKCMPTKIMRHIISFVALLRDICVAKNKKQSGRQIIVMPSHVVYA